MNITRFRVSCKLCFCVIRWLLDLAPTLMAYFLELMPWELLQVRGYGLENVKRFFVIVIFLLLLFPTASYKREVCIYDLLKMRKRRGLTTIKICSRDVTLLSKSETNIKCNKIKYSSLGPGIFMACLVSICNIFHFNNIPHRFYDRRQRPFTSMTIVILFILTVPIDE